jgi:hypothetical protein
MTNKERADAQREREIEQVMRDMNMTRSDAELYVAVVRGRVRDTDIDNTAPSEDKNSDD